MKRVTLTRIAAIAVFGLGGLAAGVGLSLNEGALSEPSVATPAAPAPEDDPCAEYLAQGIACEFIAFEEMEIKPAGGPAVARR